MTRGTGIAGTISARTGFAFFAAGLAGFGLAFFGAGLAFLGFAFFGAGFAGFGWAFGLALGFFFGFGLGFDFGLRATFATVARFRFAFAIVVRDATPVARGGPRRWYVPPVHGTALLAALMVLAPAPERPPVQRPSGLRPRKDPSPKPEPKPAPRPDPSPPPAPEVPTQAVPDSPLEPAPEPPLTPPAADPPTEFVAPLAPPPAPEGPEPVSVSGELPPDPIEAPRWTGIGPLVSAGVLGAAAFAQQAGAWSRAKANCDRPIETKGAGTSLAFVDCLAEESRALTLRITSAVSLGAAIGLGTLGAVIIGRRHAHSDAGSGHTRKTKAMIGAGASFAAIGLVSWITTRWLVQRNRIGCDTEACAVKADMLTLDASALVSAIGGGLLGYSLGYRNRRRALAEQVALVPTVGADSVGIRVGGRF